jgi:hypothetical protein
VVRPAGFEPAAFGSGGQRKETTGGSVEPLPLILLAFCHIPNHPRLPRATTDCQSFVSQLTAQETGAQARTRAAREGWRDLAFRRPRLGACEHGPANRMNLSGCSRLATEVSSSMASQCIPIPPPIDSQSFRCCGVAARSRGNHTNGTETVRLSSRTTISESSEHETSTASASPLSTEVGVPLLQEPVPTNPQQGWRRVSLLWLPKSSIAWRKSHIEGGQDV